MAERTPVSPGRRATMVDVAALAGVSQTTVSLILNGATEARLSTLTRQRVAAAAEHLGYRLTRRSPPRVLGGVIGFLVDEIATDPWMAMALDGIRDKAREHGLTVFAVVTQGDPDLAEAAMTQLSGQPLAGLIHGTIQTRRIPLWPVLTRQPTVLLNCYVTGGGLPSVLPGDPAGARAATERLIRAGHRRIALIEGEAGMDTSRDRRRGYRQALAAAGLPFAPDLVRPGNWEPSAGYTQTLALLSLPAPPTAIFCANDMTALGCYEALKERGLAIPQDVAVVGYDDREVAQYARPPLTTVLLPHREMGARAADLLVALKAGHRVRSVTVPCPLVDRASV